MTTSTKKLTTHERATYSWDDWDDEYEYTSYGTYNMPSTPSTTKKNKQRRSLSEFWRSRWSTRADEDEVLDASGHERPQAFVKHLRAIRGTVRFVFGKSVSVAWAVEDVSFTNITEGSIVISPRFLKEQGVNWKDWTIDQRVDACHGAALHEGAHNRWTPEASMYEMQKMGGQLLGQLFNIMEDGYIETEITYNYPGFSGYIDALWDFYLTPQQIEEHLHVFNTQDMTKVVFEASDSADAIKLKQELVWKQLSAFINLMIAAMKSRNDVDLTQTYLLGGRHEKMAKAIERLVQIYRACEQAGIEYEARVDASNRAYRIICALFAQNENEDDQQGPKAFVLNETKYEEMLGDLFKGGGVGEAAGMKNTPAGTDKAIIVSGSKGDAAKNVITEGTRKLIDALLSANLRNVEVEQFHSGVRGREVNKVAIVDMRPTEYGTRRYVEETQNTRRFQQRLKKALKFRSSNKEYVERERPYGKIDATRLSNLLAFKDKDIFYRKITTSAPRAHIGVLIDESGSMRDGTHGLGAVPKELSAMRTAIMMQAVLQAEQTTTYEIWGHTGDVSGVYGGRSYSHAEPACPIEGADFEGPLLMRYMDSVDGMTDPRVLGRMVGRGNNYDGFALEVVSKHMAENSDSPLKVLFIVCDGMPAGYGYPSPMNVTHTKEQVNKSRKRGVQVISIFVGSLGHAEDNMKTMYGRKDHDWIHVPSSDNLPAAMERISARILRWNGE